MLFIRVTMQPSVDREDVKDSVLERVYLGALKNKQRASRSVAPPLCAPPAPLRRYADRCCAARQAGRQAGKAAAAGAGDAHYNGQAHVGKVRNATFACFLI